jgi:F-type H+-transporting ATPase subunit gamma
MKRFLDFKTNVENYEDVSVTIKTIEQIAASQIHRFKNDVANLEDYISNIKRGLARLTIFYEAKSYPLLLKRNSGDKLLIVITSNKGLVGGLYHDIISKAVESQHLYTSIYVVGERGKQYLQEENIVVSQPYFELSDIPDPTEIKTITDHLFTAFTTKSIQTIDILYPSFLSLGEQSTTISQFLPFNFENDLTEKNNLKPSANDGFPIFESSKQRIFQELLSKYIQSAFYKIIIESKLSEFAARTVSMEHASAKIKHFKSNLEAMYFKERRLITTQKQLESFTAHILR